MDRGYTPKQLVALFVTCNAFRQVDGVFAAEFGVEMLRGDWVNAAAAVYEK